MSGYRFEPDDLESASDGWRPLDRALLRWVLAHGGSERLATTAAWASVADGNGDTALPLRDADLRPGWRDDEVAALRSEPMVARDDGGRIAPFVLDGDGRFYLWRNRRDESVVVERIRERRASGAGIAVAGDDLDALFQGRDDAAVGPQRAAVAQVAGRRLFVLTGGPGTGKTTTVLRMLLMLQRIAGAPLAIRLAAPTGKAAQRLVQSLRDGKRALLEPGWSLPVDWHPLVEAVPDREATTLHRLLGYQPWNNRFRRNAREPIAADVVVVDEASMIDLSMLRCLLDALRPETTLILVGDADQLFSIAAGSALMDLVSVMESERAGDLVRLRHSFRAEPALAAINETVRRGDVAAFVEAWGAAGERAIRRDAGDPRQLAIALRGWAEGLARHAPEPLPADEKIRAEAALSALRAQASRQLLCALREGEFGAIAANAAIEFRLRQAWNVPDDAHWYAGRAVMVTRNDYAAGLFNGDIGLCLAGGDGRLHVWFSGLDETGQPTARRFEPQALTDHEGAFAITIHKSQGSEYERVAVLLPPDADSPILSRQLLYTGLSRAKATVELWSSDAALDAALARPVRRAGGLAARLRED
jgi:exodeoxyribonuclease V alpha subunit